MASRASSAWYLVSAMTAATSWPWKRTLSVASTACASPLNVGMRWRRGLRLCPRPGGVLDRLDDVHVAGAAANVARDRPTDLFLARVGVALEQRRAHQHHARRAEAALQAVLFVEAGLDRRQGRALREALDSHDVAALHLDREQRARLDGFAIEERRARAAAGRVAADARGRLPKACRVDVD